jgi:aminopeptidase N
MGGVFLEQLKYIVGEENFYKGMRRYYNTYKMRHPEPNDFIRIMEKVSGLQLHWYLRYWTGTTKRIDYGIADVQDKQGATAITLERKGEFPMPLEVVVTLTDGSQELYYVPMNELLGSKPDERKGMPRTDTAVWPWVNPSFTWTIPTALTEIATIEIDPSQRMADINRANNVRAVNEKK